jgi:Spy/CpxP family protein refolding chaperone
MRRVILAGVILSLTTVGLAAQPPARGGRLPPRNRAELEQSVKQRLAMVVQRQLSLTDEQMRRVSDINQKYEARRMELLRRDHEARVTLRRELIDSAAPNEERVGQLLQEMGRIQHERLDLVDAEQADLARFLSASQRARYLGIQEQMRRRIEPFRDRPAFMDEQAPGRGRGLNPRMNRRPPPPA